MGIKERVKILETKIGKIPQDEMEKVGNIFGRLMVQLGGAGWTLSNDGSPVTQEEFEFLMSRLERLKRGV